MKTIHLALNVIPPSDGIAKHFNSEVTWIKDGIVSLKGKEYDLSKSMLEIALDATDDMNEPEVLIWSVEKIKTAPVYVREHNCFTIGCIYFDSSSQEFFVVTTDKFVTLNNKSFTANVSIKRFPNTIVRKEQVGINTSILKIIENTFRKFWLLEETNAYYPFHTKFNHIRVKRIFSNTELTHFIGSEEVNTLTLSINRNHLEDGKTLHDFNHSVIANGCSYELKDKLIIVKWTQNSSIEIIPNKVDRVLVNGHSIQLDTGYTNIRLIKQ